MEMIPESASKVYGEDEMHKCQQVLVAQTENNLPAMQDTWVQSLGQKDTLEKGMATHSGILAWRIPGTEEPGGLHSKESQRAGLV